MKVGRCIQLAAGTLTVLVAVASIAAAATDPLWTISFEKDIKWQQLTATGHLVASTDEGLVGIDPATGEVAWKMEDLKGLEEDRFDLIPFTQYAVVQKGKGMFGALNRMIVIDYVSGEEKWNSDKLGIQSSMGQFLLPSQSALFIYGRNEKGKSWVRLADLETGELRWENKEFFKKRDPHLFSLSASKQTIVGNQRPLFDTDDTFITFMNKKALRKWDAKTGERIWELEIKAKAPPAVKWGYPAMMLVDNVLYVPYEKKLQAVDVVTGTFLWEKEAKLKGIVYQMSLIDEGLLVKGGPAGDDGDPFVILLDPATGKKVWKKEFKKLKKEGSTNFVIHDDKVVMWSDKKLWRVNISDGKHEEWVKDLKFEGGERPSSLRKTDEGFRLMSSQNLMVVDYEGAKRFHSYHKAPGKSMFAKIASTALIAAVNVGSAMDGTSRAMQSSDGRAQYSLISSNPILSKRFKATANSERYTYILTDIKADGEKGPGLVKVDKQTGKTESHIILGTKEPVYEVDAIDAKLYFVDDKKTIVAYAF